MKHVYWVSLPGVIYTGAIKKAFLSSFNAYFLMSNKELHLKYNTPQVWKYISIILKSYYYALKAFNAVFIDVLHCIE